MTIPRVGTTGEKVMKPTTYIPPDFSKFVEGMDYTDTKRKYSVK